MKTEIKTATRNGGPKARLRSFRIIWSEGSGRFDNRTFETWASANIALKCIAREHEQSETNPDCYTKVRVEITWSNGHQIVDRLDIYKKGFWPLVETAGQYLHRRNAVMYASTIQVGDRDDLMWSDNDFEQPGMTLKEVIDMQAKTFMWN